MIANEGVEETGKAARSPPLRRSARREGHDRLWRRTERHRPRRKRVQRDHRGRVIVLRQFPGLLSATRCPIFQMWPREGFFQFEKERKTGHEIETPTRQASNTFAGVPRGVIGPLMRMLVSRTALGTPTPTAPRGSSPGQGSRLEWSPDRPSRANLGQLFAHTRSSTLKRRPVWR